jgi:hypothetical protein
MLVPGARLRPLVRFLEPTPAHVFEQLDHALHGDGLPHGGLGQIFSAHLIVFIHGDLHGLPPFFASLMTC